MNVTAEVNATIDKRTEIIQLTASTEFIHKINEGMLHSSPGKNEGVRIVITGVFRLYNEQGSSMDVSELGG